MSQKDQTTLSALKGQLTKIFGRVVSHPDVKSGRPFLSSNFVEVLDVLKMIRNGMSDGDICRKYSHIKQPDIDACRAWQARFLVEDLKDAFNLTDDRNIFMLDENTSYLILHDVVRLFGPSSHVYAEGLYDERNDDETDIWAHVVEHEYQAVLTADADFKQISINYRSRMNEKFGSLENCTDHIPAVIFVGPSNRQQTRKLLIEWQGEIKKFMAENDAPYATLTETGLLRAPKDRAPANQPHTANDNHRDDQRPAPNRPQKLDMK